MVSGVGGQQPIMFTGLASGIDTAGIIQKLLDARKGPLKAAQDQQAASERRAAALRDVKTRLTNLYNQIKNFVDAGYLQGKKAAVTPGGTSPSVAVSAGSSAATGTFTVTVQQMATATRVSSPTALGAAINPTALLKDANLATPVTAGTFTVNGVTISVDPTVDTLDAVMQRIQTNVSGITVSLVADPDGRPNRLQLSHPGGVTLGAGSDTSNFLSAMKLLASPAGTTRTSTGNLGVVRASELLSTTMPTLAASGTFKINGVSISYDASRDSLSAVLSRINASAAGVTASYDAATDKVTIVAKKTGSTAVTFEDVSGNFLNAIGVLTATQTLGQNAQIQVDAGNGPVTYYSTSNTVTDAVPGVTITLLRQSATADTVTVAQDVDGAVGRMKDLVTQFNSTLDFINQQMKFNTDNPLLSNGPLAGDAGLMRIASTLRTMITARIDGVSGGKTSLADLGVSFGAVGSAVGTTNTLTLNEAKFRAALEADPAGVANVLAAFQASATLQPGGTGSVAAISGTPTAVRKPGTYTVTTTDNGDGTAKVTATFKPADGGPSVETVSDRVTPGSILTGLIPGLTVTLKPTVQAGTDTITVTTPVRGIAAKFEQYLEPLVRADGLMDRRLDEADRETRRIKDNIDRINERLDRERQLLQEKFARMETAIAQLQAQRSSLTALALLGLGAQ
jgi:flagellar hook-associated protein 2